MKMTLDLYSLVTCCADSDEDVAIQLCHGSTTAERFAQVKESRVAWLCGGRVSGMVLQRPT